MAKSRRKQYYIERSIQIGIVYRFLMHVGFAFFFITLPLSFIRTRFDPSQLWTKHVFDVWQDNMPMLICVALFVPFAIFDLIRFSHRIVGPIFRLKNEFKKLEEGEDCTSNLQFRENDFWQDLSSGFNHLTEQIQDLRAKNEELEARLAEK